MNGGKMKQISGLDINTTKGKLGFEYGADVFGTEPELRKLDDIRKSLKNPNSDGPMVLYSIAMDVGKKDHMQEIEKRNLLFGVVTFAAGKIGNEPIRSQGHIHAVSKSCGYSTPEVYEIWEGEAVIYMQESGTDHAGNCYAVYAKEGEVVIVPPGWVHATVNVNTQKNMTFGAWCVRDYGFDYEDVRRHNGIAFFPEYENETLCWKRNLAYKEGILIKQNAREYTEFEIVKEKPIYTQFEENMELFDFVSNPQNYKQLWKNYRP